MSRRCPNCGSLSTAPADYDSWYCSSCREEFPTHAYAELMCKQPACERYAGASGYCDKHDPSQLPAEGSALSGPRGTDVPEHPAQRAGSSSADRSARRGETGPRLPEGPPPGALAETVSTSAGEPRAPKIPVPAPDTPWSNEVIGFALSYNGYDRHGTDVAGRLGNGLLAHWRVNRTLDADLPTLRCALFFEQRRGHWLDRPPDPDYLRALLTEIQRLTGGWVDGPPDEGP